VINTITTQKTMIVPRPTLSPATNSMILPAALQNILTHILKEEYNDFILSLTSDNQTSIHINNRKYLPAANVTPQVVPWFEKGHFLSVRPAFQQEPLFHAGAYYVQESSSMFLAEAIRQLVLKRGKRPIENALDLCAAPGGKSFLMDSQLPEESLLLCNEIISSRYKVLRNNLDKWGSVRTYSAQHTPEELLPLGPFFDFILVDAPCSGEGMIRKSEAVISNWSEKSVAGCALRQQNILEQAIALLRPGGMLVYSTCTYNPSENIDNALWLNQYGLHNIPLDLKEEWNIMTIKKQGVHGYQFFPHRGKGEGFFLTCFEKEDNGTTELPLEFTKKSKSKKQADYNKKKPYWISLPAKERDIVAPWLEAPDQFDFFQDPSGQVKIILKAHQEAAMVLENTLRSKAIGTLVGSIKGSELIPVHQLALSAAISAALPALNLSKEEALLFLKKENFELPEKASGWTLMRYEGVNLGWIKALPNRFNNYLPGRVV
jgi:16S rRNA C967 or C1407 C5-methylase (RsmB/RsmF family)/NOL1/NOP2/fmu family ribosome biogenesis protein